MKEIYLIVFAILCLIAWGKRKTLSKVWSQFADTANAFSKSYSDVYVDTDPDNNE
jgi:hypothetical protein